MEAVVMSLPIFAFAGLVGRDLLLSTVSGTSKGILYILSNLTSGNEPGTEKINIILEKIDIEHKITVLNSLISDLSDNKELPESITRSIIGVQDTLDMIHSELIKIQEKVKHHKEKWFNYWRTINAKDGLKKIERHAIVLSQRTNMLLNLLQIPKDKLKISLISLDGESKRNIKNLNTAIIKNYK